MLKQDIKILVVEDDESVGRSIEEAFKRSGFSCRWIANPDEALTAFKISSYHVAIIDCMLPRTNGVQLAQSMRQIIGRELKIILISGIFRDRSFINDAIHKTQAEDFYLKPINNELLVDSVQAFFIDELEVDREPLFQLLSRESHSLNERLDAIEKTETIHGFDLPLVYSLLIGTTVSGKLNILSAEGDVFFVDFQNGKIVQVQINDKTSYFGVLLVEHGFTSNEDVKQILIQPGDKPIGERLVEASALSPHAIDIIRKEQLGIRLSKTIQDTSVQVNFIPEQEQKRDLHNFDGIDIETWHTHLNDWIISKLSLNWLRAFYTPWLEYSIKLGPEKSRFELIKDFPLMDLSVPLLKLSTQVNTLQQLINETIFGEEKVLRVIHFLLIERVFVFSSRPVHKLGFDQKKKLLNNLLKEFETQNHFEILGISQSAKDKEINRSYLELAKVLHPDKVESGAPEEIKNMQSKVFYRIAEAYDILRDRDRREIYIKELNLGRAEEVIHVENQFEEAVRYLNRCKYRNALEILSRLTKNKNHRADIILYLVWARLKVGYSKEGQEKFIEEIAYQLNQIPPEERHTPAYIFVKGLYLKLIGKHEKAYSYFKHAVTMDPSFSAAKREMIALEGENSQKALSGDLTSVMNMFFANKGKGARGRR